MKKILFSFILIVLFCAYASAETVQESTSNDGINTNTNVSVELRGASIENSYDRTPFLHGDTVGNIPQFYDDAQNKNDQGGKE